MSNQLRLLFEKIIIIMVIEMANLNFIYGTMESGKTTKLLQDNYNYQRHGHNVIIIKPKIDTKGGSSVITRNKESEKADILLDKNETILSKDNLKLVLDAKVILVDEAQFFTQKQIFAFWQIAHIFNITVICYGLKNDFQGNLFEGTAALFSYADQKTELTVQCECGNIAIFNARCVGGQFTNSGDLVAIDGEHNVSYIPLCSDCYLKKVIGKSNIDDIIE